MKKMMMTAILILGFSGFALAGPGHEHGHSHGPISATEAQGKATEQVKRLIQKGKLESSWTSVLSGAKVEQKTFSKGPEWVISYNNPKVADKSKQTLYLFYSLDGHYLAANFSGN